MDTLMAEIHKLKRSQSWGVVIVLPLVVVAAGTLTSILSGRPLSGGWDTLWQRTVVFHGLAPLALGVAVLASLTWRSEHRGGNWNALMAGPTSSGQIVVAKTLVVALLAAAMQVVLVVAVVLVGKLAFALPGWPPASYLTVSGLVVLAGLPLAAVQSALSMVLRSFAAPVALALVGAGAGLVLLVAGVDGAIFVLPHVLAARATQVGSGVFGDAGVLGAGPIGTVLLATALLTAVVLASATRTLDRRDVQA